MGDSQDDLSAEGTFYFCNFIGKSLICGVVLALGAQQSDSVTRIHSTPLFRWFSHIVYYKVLSRVPCALQESPLIGYLFYMQECVYVVVFIKIFDVDHFKDFIEFVPILPVSSFGFLVCGTLSP